MSNPAQCNILPFCQQMVFKRFLNPILCSKHLLKVISNEIISLKFKKHLKRKQLMSNLRKHNLMKIDASHEEHNLL